MFYRLLMICFATLVFAHCGKMHHDNASKSSGSTAAPSKEEDAEPV